MDYQNYETAIVSHYKAQLVGWPDHIPFSNPSNINTHHLQRLADTLQSLQCRWQLMTRDEVAAHNAKHDATMASGGTVGKVRKPCSDKNKKRVTHGEGGVPTIRARTGGKATPGAPSTAGARVQVSRQLPPQFIHHAFEFGGSGAD